MGKEILDNEQLTDIIRTMDQELRDAKLAYAKLLLRVSDLENIFKNELDVPDEKTNTFF